MKFIWTVLIHLAILLIVAAITICFIIYYSPTCDHRDELPLFEPTLEGYKNHQLIQFIPKNDQDVKKLVELQNKLSLVPWSNVLRIGWPVLIQVPPEQVKSLIISTEALHLPFILLSSNIQDYLINRKRVITEFNLTSSADFNFNRYHYFTEIEKYLNKLSEEEPNRLIVNSYGTSIESRQLYYARIFKSIEQTSKDTDNVLKDKKIVIIECGTHSREWLSPAVCLQIINSLVKDPESQELLEEYEFYVLPLINPDGYAYSWSTDRLWRKNRRRFANNCYGVDLNRNFNVGFNVTETPEHIHLLNNLEDLKLVENTLKRFKRFIDNSSTEPIQCSNLYPGERPFSENESFYLKRFIDNFSKRPHVYISLHAYSQMWLYPFGINLTSEVNDKLHHYAKIGVESLQNESNKLNLTSTIWKYGRAIDVMYNAGGISIDWAHKDVGIELVYTLEMKDSGKYGFLIPEDEIEPAFKEVWSGLKAVLTAYAIDLNNNNNNSTIEESN